MQGLMQQYPLTLPPVLDRAERLFADKRIVTARAGGDTVETTFSAWAQETRRLGQVFDDLRIAPDGRIGSFGFNTARHLAIYWAAPCSGRILHTLNVRLFPEQLTYIINHAEDEVVFLDRSLLPVLWPLAGRLPTVRQFIVMDDGGTTDLPDDPRILDYDELIAAAGPAEFHVDDENLAAAMCYTSGTTGNPRGVLYSHRSLYLHALSVMTSEGMQLAETDTLLPVVPMFHANCWGLAQAPIFTGSDIVLPGPRMAPEALLELISQYRVTITAGVPTIWMGLLPLLDRYDLSALTRVICGGSAVPKALSEGFRAKLGFPIVHAWGMTETSPLGSLNHRRSSMSGWDEDRLAEERTRQGVPPVGVEARITEPGTTTELPWDDVATGELQVRGPWIAAGYYGDESGTESFTPDGWLRTGDVAAINGFGSIRIVDRTKDLVKSGGEWISSVELENHLMAHPAVAEAAVIAVPHQRWQERPLACVVLKEGQSATEDDLIEHLRPLVAKWWLPDAVAFVPEIPKTSVGKFSKKRLREQFAGYRLPEG